MARYIAEEAYICSIYPGQPEPLRRNYGPSRDSVGKSAMRSSLFVLPPVGRKEKPFVLTLSDCFEDVLDVMSQSGHSGGPRPRMPKPVPVETIVEDLVGRWTGGIFNVPDGARPGIMQINNSAPSQAELKQLREQQGQYFEYWFAQGEALFRGDPTTVNNYKTYTTEMRLAADWLGRSRPWSDVTIAAESVSCQWCTTVVSNLAIYCPNCQRQLLDEYGERVIPAEVMKAAAAAKAQQPQKGA